MVFFKEDLLLGSTGCTNKHQAGVTCTPSLLMTVNDKNVELSIAQLCICAPSGPATVPLLCVVKSECLVGPCRVTYCSLLLWNTQRPSAEAGDCQTKLQDSAG